MHVVDRVCATVRPSEWQRHGNVGWTYWVPGHVGRLEEGDWVIVESPRDAYGTLVAQSGIPILAEVVDAAPPRTMRKKATRWLISKVEWEPYRALQALAPMIEGEN